MKIVSKFFKIRYYLLVIVTILCTISLFAMSKVHVSNSYEAFLPDNIPSIDAKDVIVEDFNIRALKLLVRSESSLNDNQILTIRLRLESQLGEYLSNGGLKIENNERIDDALIFTVNIRSGLTQQDYKDIENISLNILDSYNLTGGLFTGTVIYERTINTIPVFIVTAILIASVILLFTKSLAWLFIIVLNTVLIIIIQQGSNLIFGELTFIEQTVSPIIISVLSLNYSLILLYNLNKYEDLTYAIYHSINPILASSATTIAGQLALSFLTVRIGYSLALVLSKGVLIAVIISIIVVPTMYLLIDRNRRRLEYKNLRINNRVRNILVGFVMLLTITSVLFQSNLKMVYADARFDDVTEFVAENFPIDNNIYVVTSSTNTESVVKYQEYLIKNNVLKEKEIKILSHSYLKYEFLDKEGSVIEKCYQKDKPSCDLIKSIDIRLDSNNLSEKLLRNIFLEAINTRFYSVDKEKQVINFELNDLDDLDEFMSITKEYLGEDVIITGYNIIEYELNGYANKDMYKVSLIALVLVLVALLITLRKIILSLVFLLIIIASIYINLFISVVTGDVLLVMGVIIVTSIQLGSNVDYSIVYLDAQKNNNSQTMIYISALSLSVAGISMYFMLHGVLSQLGYLLARGTLISLLITLLVVPIIHNVMNRKDI